MDINELLKPVQKSSRKLFGLDFETTIVPFFTATNVAGKTAIPVEALGAPLRLRRDSEGQVKLGKTGRPVVQVAKELKLATKMVVDNLAASMNHYANSVFSEQAEAYADICHKAQAVGQLITSKDTIDAQLALVVEATPKVEAVETPQVLAPAKNGRKVKVLA